MDASPGPGLPELLRLAREAGERSQRTGDVPDLDAAVAAWEAAVDAASGAEVSAADRAEILGPELAARYRQAAGALAPVIRSLGT